MKLLPNLLTLTRLILAPFLFHQLWTAEFRTALWILALAGATDGLDGFLARRFGWTTRQGAVLDPIADKVLLSGVYLTMGIAGDVPLWLTEIVVGRDLLLLAGAAMARWFGALKRFPPSWLGKFSTLAQIITAVSVIADRAVPAAGLIRTAQSLFMMTAILAVASGLHYYIRGWRDLNTRKAPA